MVRLSILRDKFCRLLAIVATSTFLLGAIHPNLAQAQLSGGLFGGQHEEDAGGLFGNALNGLNSSEPPKEQEATQSRNNVEAEREQDTTRTVSGNTDALQKIFRQLQQMHAQNDVPTSPTELMAAVGQNEEELHRWVRTNILLVPYLGELRGADGVLRDRRGNSADQALLIQAALEAAGRQSRLLRGTLRENQTENLMDRASRAPLDGRPVQRPLDGTRAEEEYLIALSRLETQPRDILAAMDGLRENLKDLRSRERDRAMEVLAEHWWVQGRIDDVWIDIDPLAEQFGTTLGIDGREELPEQHQVSVRLLGRDANGHQSTLLNLTRPAADLAGQLITFAHHPDKVEGEVENWLPVLTLGEEIILGSVISSGTGFQDPSVDNLVPFTNQVAGAEQIGSAVESALNDAAGMLGGLGGETGSAAPERRPRPDFEFVQAEWIEIEVAAPGREPLTARRDLFDLSIGSSDQSDQEVRENGWTRRTLMKTETAALTQRVLLGRLIPTVERVLEGSKEQSPQDVTPPNLTRDILAIELDTFSFQRWRWNPYGAVTYVDRPNVHAVHLERTGDGHDSSEIRRRFDVLVNEVGVQLTNRVDPFAARLYQGVIDTVAEALVLREPHSNQNASAVHQQMTAEHVLQPMHQATEAGLTEQMSPLMRSHVERVIDTGGVALVFSETPDQNGTEAWWRIDPKTGTTLGYVGQYGQVLSGEYPILLDAAALNSIAWAAGLSVAYYQSACLAAAAICSLASAAGDVAETGVEIVTEGEQLVCDNPQLRPEISIIPTAAAINHCVNVARDMACPAAAFLTLLHGTDDPSTANRPRDLASPGAEDGLRNNSIMNESRVEGGGAIPGPGRDQPGDPGSLLSVPDTKRRANSEALRTIERFGPGNVRVFSGPIHRHHAYPQELRDRFEAAGIDIDEHILRIPERIHQKIHIGPRGGLWNEAWIDWFRNNPNAGAPDIRTKLDDMIHNFDLDQYRQDSPNFAMCDPTKPPSFSP